MFPGAGLSSVTVIVMDILVHKLPKKPLEFILLSRKMDISQIILH